jgi:hypothetical protein
VDLNKLFLLLVKGLLEMIILSLFLGELMDLRKTIHCLLYEGDRA